MPPPPPKDLPKRASPRHSPRRETVSLMPTSLNVKLGGAADAVARLKALRDAVNDIQSTNLRAKSLLESTDKVLKVGPDGGLDVQAMSFVAQRRASVEETGKREDEAHARMKEVAFVAEQKMAARNTEAIARSQRMLEHALPAEQVAQSRVHFGHTSSNPRQPTQVASSTMLNPYSVARPSGAMAANTRPAQSGNWPQPTGAYNAFNSPYPGLQQAAAPGTRPYMGTQGMYPGEGRSPYNTAAPANPAPAYGSPYPGVQRPGVYAGAPQPGMYPSENPHQPVNRPGFYAL